MSTHLTRISLNHQPNLPRTILVRHYRLVANNMPPGGTSVLGKNPGFFVPLNTILFNLQKPVIHT